MLTAILRQRALLLAGCFAAVVVAGIIHRIPAAAHGDELVTIHTYRFDPADVTVHAGETVTWTNQDRAAHDVTFASGDITSGPLATDGSFSFTFDEPGSVSYRCSVHPDMTGTVMVLADTTSTTADAALVAAPRMTTPPPLSPPAAASMRPRRTHFSLDPRLVLAAMLAGVVVYCALLLGRAAPPS